MVLLVIHCDDIGMLIIIHVTDGHDNETFAGLIFKSHVDIVKTLKDKFRKSTYLVLDGSKRIWDGTYQCESAL